MGSTIFGKEYKPGGKIMKLHYGGQFKTEDDFKVKGEIKEGSVPFREPEAKKFAIIANGGCVLLLIVLLVIAYFLAGKGIRQFLSQIGVATIISMITLIPHEFFHASCFKEDVYLYYDLSKALLFVHGTEDMSKARFVFMSMLPNIVFGIVPYVLFLINHDWLLIGMIGAFCIGMGFGDYVNVFNALTQMPKGAKTYLCGFHSYWHK